MIDVHRPVWKCDGNEACGFGGLGKLTVPSQRESGNFGEGNWPQRVGALPGGGRWGKMTGSWQRRRDWAGKTALAKECFMNTGFDPSSSPSSSPPILDYQSFNEPVSFELQRPFLGWAILGIIASPAVMYFAPLVEGELELCWNFGIRQFTSALTLLALLCLYQLFRHGRFLLTNRLFAAGVCLLAFLPIAGASLGSLIVGEIVYMLGPLPYGLQSLLTELIWIVLIWGLLCFACVRALIGMTCVPKISRRSTAVAIAATATIIEMVASVGLYMRWWN